jgi:hypothetical protein
MPDIKSSAPTGADENIPPEGPMGEVPPAHATACVKKRNARVSFFIVIQSPILIIFLSDSAVSLTADSHLKHR